MPLNINVPYEFRNVPVERVFAVPGDADTEWYWKTERGSVRVKLGQRMGFANGQPVRLENEDATFGDVEPWQVFRVYGEDLANPEPQRYVRRHLTDVAIEIEVFQATDQRGDFALNQTVEIPGGYEGVGRG